MEYSIVGKAKDSKALPSDFIQPIKKWCSQKFAYKMDEQWDFPGSFLHAEN